MEDLEKTIERYVNGVKWLTTHEEDENYEKALKKLENLENSLRKFGLSNDEIGELIAGAKEDLEKG